MEPRIQYAKTTDGVSIAYWTLGRACRPSRKSLDSAMAHDENLLEACVYS